MVGGAKIAVNVDAQVTDWSTSDRDGAARKLWLPTSRRTPHHLSLLSVKVETIRSHPVRYALHCERNVSGHTGNGSRQTRAANLAVVSVLLQRQTVVGDNRCKKSCVGVPACAVWKQNIWLHNYRLYRHCAMYLLLCRWYPTVVFLTNWMFVTCRTQLIRNL